jgi:hypothetical protein
MIFDSSDDSMQDEGNKAAHEAPLADRVDSVLGASIDKDTEGFTGGNILFCPRQETQFQNSLAMLV